MVVVGAWVVGVVLVDVVLMVGGGVPAEHNASCWAKIALYRARTAASWARTASRLGPAGTNRRIAASAASICAFTRR